MLSRRDFLRRSSTLAALAAVGPRAPWTGLEPRTVPVIDGLCLASERMAEGPAATGLDAFILDVSGGAEVKQPGGAAVYLRTLDATRTAVASIRGTLENIAARVAESGFAAPAVAVFGDVVNLRETLRWSVNVVPTCPGAAPGSRRCPWRSSRRSRRSGSGWRPS